MLRQEADQPGILAVAVLEGEGVGEGVHALVEPRLEVLAGGEQTLEVLVAELVDGGEDAAHPLVEDRRPHPVGAAAARSLVV